MTADELEVVIDGEAFAGALRKPGPL